MLLVLIVLCAVIQNRQKKAIRKKSVADVGVVSSGTGKFFLIFGENDFSHRALKTMYFGHFFVFQGSSLTYFKNNIIFAKIAVSGHFDPEKQISCQS